MLKYYIIILFIFISTPIKDKYDRTIGYSRQQGNRTVYSNKYNQRQFSTQNRNKSLIINGKYK